MTTLAAPTYVNGMWFISSASPPDRSIPSNLAPPGNAPGSGFWAIQDSTNPGKGQKMQATRWVWCPLPVGNIMLVMGPNGPVPTVSLGAPYQITTWENGQSLADGPWPALGTGPNSGYTGVQGPPSVDPSGWSGGTWTNIAGSSGLWAYDNGQLSNSSALAWAAVGTAVVGAGAYLALK
jgi:hypothetical protein